jgi:hypothetical protein
VLLHPVLNDGCPVPHGPQVAVHLPDHRFAAVAEFLGHRVDGHGRPSSYVLTFSKEGYSPATFNIQNHSKGGIIVADVLLTGLVGVIIDAVTGGWYGLSPEAATVSLTKIALVPGPDTIRVNLARAEHGAVKVSTDASGVMIQVDKR